MLATVCVLQRFVTFVRTLCIYSACIIASLHSQSLYVLPNYFVACLQDVLDIIHSLKSHKNHYN